MSKIPVNPRRELGVILIAICASALVLPGLIFVVGNRIFGAYDGGIAAMYQNTLQDLLALRPAPWIIVFGPALCIALLRMVFHVTAEPAPEPAQRARREPTLTP